MNYEQINALVLDDVFFSILYRLVEFVEGEEHYTILEEGESLYDRVVLAEGYVKPTLQEMEDELVVYKAELTAQEDARLAEVARKEDLNTRFSAIAADDAGYPSFYQLVQDEPNAVAYLNALINDISRAEEAETFMVQLEAKHAEIMQERSDSAYIDLRKAAYPDVADFLDAMVKVNSVDEALQIEGQAQLDAYYAACLAVKVQYPKPE